MDERHKKMLLGSMNKMLDRREQWIQNQPDSEGDPDQQKLFGGNQADNEEEA